MTQAYRPVAPYPRPIPWPIHATASVLIAISLADAISSWAPDGPEAAIAIFAPLLIAVVLDAVGRSHFIGAGLERSVRQLLALGASLAVLVVVGSALEDLAPVLAAIIALACGAGAYGVLRWDQSVQLTRARIIAQQIDAVQREES